jgi:hypothetical protein
MGDQYIKIDGAWTPVKRPYVKVGNIWKPVKKRFHKEAGQWAEEWAFDTTPPNPPELSLQLIPASNPRYIRVGARLPGTVHDSGLRRIKVHAARSSGILSTQFGSGMITGNDASYPKEDWSNWWYNDAHPGGTSDHGNSHEYDYKEYPVNPTDATNLPGGQRYYFAAWAEDLEGNWSIGTFANIWMPKQGVSTERKVLKEANVEANRAGYLNGSGDTFTEGDLVVSSNPVSNGIWFHGGKFTNSVGLDGPPTITSARIRVSRGNDAGQPTANVRLFWHSKADPTQLPIPYTEQMDPTVVGTINKGETKWFDIPQAWWSKFNTQIRGFGLKQSSGAQDYLVANSLATDLRSGAVHLVWEEDL